jgi:hypothetical protein
MKAPRREVVHPTLKMDPCECGFRVSAVSIEAAQDAFYEHAKWDALQLHNPHLRAPFQRAEFGNA